MAKPKIAVIISTTRATRFGERPAKWIYDIAVMRADIWKRDDIVLSTNSKD